MNKLFFIIFFVFSSLGLTAEESGVLYGDYVNCFYELHQRPFQTEFVGYDNITYSRERLSKQGTSYKQMLNDTNHDIYVFSYEGVFGVKIDEEYRNICDSFYGYEGEDSCAYDLKVKAGNSVYDLCYVKKWTGTLEKDDGTFIDYHEEDVYTGTCKSRDILSRNNSYVIKALFRSEQLNSAYFYKAMLPYLQGTYSYLAYDYIWGNGFHDNVCVDSKSKKISHGLSRQEAQSEEDWNDFVASYEERVDEFNTIVKKDICYSACKKLGVIIEIKDIKK